MSDNEFEYEERPESDWKMLEAQFGKPGPGRNYVALPAPGYNTEGIWHCFDPAPRTGYATHAMAIHWALNHALGIPTQLVPHRNIDIDIDKFPKDRYDALFDWHKEAVGIPYLYLCSMTPEVAAELGAVGSGDAVSGNLVPYCAFEGTKVSSVCRDLCNSDVFSEVWVVSEFVRRAMLAGGVNPERVRTVPAAVCDGFWKIPELRKELPAVTADAPFVFGAMGTWHVRKGIPDLIRAYFGAFRREDPVKLVIRTSAFGKNTLIRELKEEITADIAKIAREFGDDGFPSSQKQPRLGFELGTDASDAEVIAWLGSFDCFVNASYGEGLGIPHIWSKAQGIPIVSTGFGAVGELLADAKSPCDSIIEYNLEPVDPWMLKAAIMFDRDTLWARYEPRALGAAMREQFVAGRRVDERGAAYVKTRFSLGAVAPVLRRAVRDRVSVEVADRWGI